MCSCEPSCAVIAWKWFRKTLLVFGAFMDVTGVLLLGFRFSSIATGIVFLVTGSAVLTVYLLTSLGTVSRYFKKLQSPPSMNRPQERVTHEGSSHHIRDNADWDPTIYDVPAYEEAVRPMDRSNLGIWTTGVPNEKPPSYSTVIKMPQRLSGMGTASQPNPSLDRVATPAETFRGNQELFTSPTQFLRVLKPNKPLKVICNTSEHGEAMEGSSRQDTQTPPPTYEEAVDDDVFYPVEWNPVAGSSQ